MLTGSALRTEATRLNIVGRSKMSADQLRAAIAAVTGPVPAPPTSDLWAAMPYPGPTANHMRSVLAAVTAPVPAPRPLVPFRARNGKRKPSLTSRRRTRR